MSYEYLARWMDAALARLGDYELFGVKVMFPDDSTKDALAVWLLEEHRVAVTVRAGLPVRWQYCLLAVALDHVLDPTSGWTVQARTDQLPSSAWMAWQLGPPPPATH